MSTETDTLSNIEDLATKAECSLDPITLKLTIINIKILAQSGLAQAKAASELLPCDVEA